jgi:hypothetical protein
MFKGHCPVQKKTPEGKSGTPNRATTLKHLLERFEAPVFHVHVHPVDVGRLVADGDGVAAGFGELLKAIAEVCLAPELWGGPTTGELPNLAVRKRLLPEVVDDGHNTELVEVMSGRQDGIDSRVDPDSSRTGASAAGLGTCKKEARVQVGC